MEKFVSIGVISLILLIMFFTYFLNRKWFNNFLKLLLIIALIYMLFICGIFIDKHIREKRKSYENIEQVLNENYEYYHINIATDESFYYLVMHKTDYTSNRKEEVLIRFEDNKYTEYDKYASWTKKVDINTQRIENSGSITEYKINNEIIVIVLNIPGKIGFKEIDYIFDDNKLWSFTHSLYDYYGYYYINVVAIDDYDDNYTIYAKTDSSVYQLTEINNSYYKFSWVCVDE